MHLTALLIADNVAVTYHQSMHYHGAYLLQYIIAFALKVHVGIKFQLKHIIESRSELLASLQKMAEPSETEDVTSQTDIELF